MRFHLQGRLKQRGRVDVSVAMDLAVTQEPRIFESGNQAQDSGLLSELEMILKSDQVVGVGAQVLLAQLHDGIRSFARAWIAQSHRLHRSEAQSIAAAARDLFDRETAFEIIQIFPVRLFDSWRGDLTRYPYVSAAASPAIIRSVRAMSLMMAGGAIGSALLFGWTTPLLFWTEIRS